MSFNLLQPIAAASTTVAGFVALATSGQVAAGTDNTTAVTPLGAAQKANVIHASAHAATGSDPVTPASIGALYNVASGLNSLAIIGATSAAGSNSVSIGEGANSLQNFALSIGYNARATNFSTVAIGDSALASGYASIAVGEHTAAFEPAAVLPPFTTTIGFVAETRRAICANFRGFPNDSR